ncbi:unnamed protein product [Nesidiocoris tenuis]|uniref:Uncharacterized protein n=1 Tax=Nesidiocoris tenuis TaxID=355587 RepID=A0A6H5G0J6_9HEMI|nr:unnamed protein product [Nesidiocoris tenuis]
MDHLDRTSRWKLRIRSSHRLFVFSSFLVLYRKASFKIAIVSFLTFLINQCKTHGKSRPISKKLHEHVAAHFCASPPGESAKLTLKILYNSVIGALFNDQEEAFNITKSMAKILLLTSLGILQFFKNDDSSYNEFKTKTFIEDSMAYPGILVSYKGGGEFSSYVPNITYYNRAIVCEEGAKRGTLNSNYPLGSLYPAETDFPPFSLPPLRGHSLRFLDYQSSHRNGIRILSSLSPLRRFAGLPPNE